ncbi:MAG: 3'-5' exonuclease [Candidatus Desulfaltia sp.]|nr:3'-5' exonuclease [Candidatus Desulfaltia sp.]
MIPWQVRQVHGITNEMLYGEPKPDEVLPEFYKFIAGSILVAHNASFDIRTLISNHILETESPKDTGRLVTQNLQP